MTEQTRDLLIKLTSHMAYMQGQLESCYQYCDPDDYYWYRESVALRQKVIDALADEPAVPDGREPASVATQLTDPEAVVPSDEDLLRTYGLAKRNHCYEGELDDWPKKSERAATVAGIRAALSRYCRTAAAPVPVSERLPGDALCWWYEPDEDDDDSGYGGSWTLLRIRGAVSRYTHWLSANALPLPAPEGGEAQP